MINVTKKELSERTFVPYEITITVSNREEHNRLVSDVKDLESIASGRWYNFGRRHSAVHELSQIILRHF